MCTSISYHSGKHYFGRNFDLAYRYHEAVTITPRNFPFCFRSGETATNHYAMIGMATVINGYPLYYDGINEHGLGIAALNFPGNAFYNHEIPQKRNLASFEIIPYVLSKYNSIQSAMEMLVELNITDAAFNESLKPSPLHWLIADENQSVVVEQTADGCHIYKNPVCVLTNNPPFPYQIQNLNQYLNLTTQMPVNRFSEHLNLAADSFGMGALGLPGDLSSISRFVRAAFVLQNSTFTEVDSNPVSHFFHILRSVEQQQGCVKTPDGLEMTIYSSCCDTKDCIYYYTTYHNHRINAVSLKKEDMDRNDLIQYPLQTHPDIKYIN